MTTTTKSDCGCGDTAVPFRPAHSKPASTSVTGGPLAGGVGGSTATPAPGASGTPGGTIVLDGFRGLNPVDGLFLRADHLSLIQDYARALTTALATASGPGVVHGLGVRLSGKTLEVSPGLAVSPRGRLLLLATTVRITLDDAHLPALPPDGFWRVELHWATGTSGSAPVYGSLCNDSCADGGATIEPWRNEGVEVRIVTDSLTGLDAVPFTRRPNWLASAYFERERAGGQPWLVPVGVGAPVSLWSNDWEDSTPLAVEAGVPLALLQGDEKNYDLDLWAARRLVDGAASQATWRDRLAMRPWSVFLAQILQFEASITGVTLEGPSQVAADLSLATFYQETAKGLLEETRRFLDEVKVTDPVRSRGSFRRLEEVVKKTAGNPLATTEPPPLTSQLGIGELPPAGYVNVHNLPGAIEGDLASFFGPNVDLRLRRLRADQVADEVIAAQHRDRIPLEPLQGRRPQVDILVPAVPADKPELSTDSYGWVAFVRRGPEAEVTPPPPPPAVETEDVEVYMLFDSEPQRFSRQFTDADLKAARPLHLGTLRFPKGGWAYPGPVAAKKALDTLEGVPAFAVVGLTAGDDRPLVATRAGLFGTSLDSGNPLPVFAFGGQPVEAIVVVVLSQIN